MYVFEVEREYGAFLEVGARGRELMRVFGMSYDSLRRRARQRRVALSLTLRPGEICYLGGASGSGKSTLLNAMYEQVAAEARVRVEDIALERDAAVIDCVDGPLAGALEVLMRAGLSDVPSLLQPPATLSEGQKWRYRLARALMSGKRVIFADEFCASLDAVTAMVIAYQLRKTADRTGCAFVLAGCREDVVGELRPERTVWVDDLRKCETAD
jgi:uncharacterized protein